MTDQTPQLHLTVLTSVLAGDTFAAVAAAQQITATTALEIAETHGYPDIDQMRVAVDMLTGQLEDLSPARVQPLPDPATLTRRTGKGKAPTAAPSDTAADLLARAAASGKARTRNLAAKVTGLLGELSDRLDAEEAQARAEAEAARRRAEAEEEIRQLESQLARARAKLRRTAGPASPTKRTKSATHTRSRSGGAGGAGAEVLTRHGVDAAQVRAWAAENDIACGSTGLLPRRVLDAYDTAHQLATAS